MNPRPPLTLAAVIRFDLDPETTRLRRGGQELATLAERAEERLP